MTATTASIRSQIATNIAATLKMEGADVIGASFEKDSVRVDVKSKKGADVAKAMLEKAGLRNVRALFERRGLWLVVGTVVA